MLDLGHFSFDAPETVDADTDGLRLPTHGAEEAALEPFLVIG